MIQPRKGEGLRILNVEFHNLTLSELLDRFDEGLLVPLNVDTLMKLQNDRAYLEVCRSAEYVVCDGQIVLFAARFLGEPLRAKISGADFLRAFCLHHKNDRTVRVFLLGAAEGVAEAARRRLNEAAGREVVVGAWSPSYGFENNDAESAAIVERIHASKATVLAVGVGAPKQERWIGRYRARLPNVKRFMAVGATLDFEAGKFKRAPAWVSRAGLEWAYRLKQEPKRLWRRYLVDDPPFFWLILKQRLGLYRDPLESENK